MDSCLHKDSYETCWVCDAEKNVEDMVFTADRYVCNTKECLLGAFEQSVEERDFIAGRLDVVHNRQ